MEGISKKKIAFIIGGIVLFIAVIVVVSVILMGLNRGKYKVTIDNIGKCSGGISDYSKDNLFDNLYNLVKAQNEIEGVSTKDNYHATLREDTCETEPYNGTDGITSYTTQAIIDIKDTVYSYSIGYSWVKNDVTQEIDLGSVEVMCLNGGDLLYDEFDCQSNPMIVSKLEVDPILSLLPYFGDNYTIKPELNEDATGYTIIIEYNPPESVYLGDVDFDSYIAGKKQSALNYLTENNINLDDYSIKETYYYIH